MRDESEYELSGNAHVHFAPNGAICILNSKRSGEATFEMWYPMHGRNGFAFWRQIWPLSFDVPQFDEAIRREIAISLAGFDPRPAARKAKPKPTKKMETQCHSLEQSKRP